VTQSASFQALGTTAIVAVTDGAVERATELLVERLDELDRACSRFRDDSELAALNRGAGRPVVVSAALHHAVRSALAAAHATGGLVDPTIAMSLKALGYDRTFTLVAARGTWHIESTAVRVGRWRCVAVDEARPVIHLPRGVALDLGSTAKAEAADQAAHALAFELGCGVLVSLGGDIAVAGEAPPEGWCVAIGDDHADAADGPAVLIRDGGLATSSTAVRRWPTDGGEMHHIVDPRTGLPAVTPWRSVSVAARTCLGANTASTAALVLGVGAPAWLEAQRLPARLVANDGSVTRTGGWPE
jgi:thiamine biosynthesis lipoprotein